MEKILVIFDENGSELGTICKRKKSFILLDKSERIVQRVSLKITLREVKEILLKRKSHVNEMIQ
ncbi:MAG: hypothetical protein QG670_2043 [Thermoproteota archaeon]|nr:hypothetical protein [Thermoproteota archaeon]